MAAPSLRLSLASRGTLIAPGVAKSQIHFLLTCTVSSSILSPSIGVNPGAKAGIGNKIIRPYCHGPSLLPHLRHAVSVLGTLDNLDAGEVCID